jgi:hypothetical protein
VKLIGTIDSIEFSDAEKERLCKCLVDDDSRAHAVILSKAPLIRDNDFWRRAQKTFHITGFRDGNPLAKQRVLTRALESTKANKGKLAWSAVGRLYIKAVQIYFEHETPNLYHLLRAEDFVASGGSETEQVFRCICRALPLHEASIDDAKELYELWGFERTPQIEEILSSVSIRADDVRRMVAESVSTMRREISGASATIKSDFIRQLEQQSRELGALKSSVESLGAVNANMSHLLTEIKVREEQRPATPVAKATPKPAPPGKEKAKTEEPARVAAAVEVLHGKIDSLSRQVRDQRTRLDAFELPSSRVPAARIRQLSSTSTQEVFQKWSPTLGLLGVADCSMRCCWLILEVIRRSRILITDKPDVITHLFRAAQDGESKSLVASPLWLTEADWKTGLEYLSQDELIPRVLVLSEFDVAIQETYLVPALINWISTLSPLSANRIVLVPSDSELSLVSPRVFEVSTLLTQHVGFVKALEKLAGTMKDLPPTLDLKQSGAAVIAFERSQNATAEAQLYRYVSNLGVPVPTRLAEHFISLFEGLRTFLSARDASIIAQQLILLPWVRAARGETVARSLQDALSALDGT